MEQEDKGMFGFVIGLVIGLFIGGAVGMFATALMVVARGDDGET